MEQGILEEQEITIGRTRKVLLRPTTTARKRFKLDTVELTRESIAHEYWKNLYAEKFRAMGYTIEVEAPRHQGRVDILAQKPSESVAVEIETGMSDVVWNVKLDLLSGFDKVLVVATDKTALKKVEIGLAQAGLLIAGRVAVVLRDELNPA